jgi:transposase InsO family protein
VPSKSLTDKGRIAFAELDANLFGSLCEVREAVHQWMTEYNEERPHKSLGNLPPSLYRQQLNQTKSAPNSNFQMSH